ncbi:MAG: MFS transporter [Nitrospiraceae bacterium]|nr:MAG: MFS transporter [Nitrospiraceae bacterium]
MPNKERFSALSFRDFRLFWFGQLISLSGTWMQSVAQAWLVYSLTKSPFYLGMVAAANALPILFFTLIGGVIADRFPKRNLLLITQGLSIIPALLLGTLTSLGIVTVWHVALVAFFLGTINAIDIPTRQSFLAVMVGRGHVVNAIALNSAAFNGARIIGPMIAGLAISYLGVPACFFLNAVSFIAVIIALAKMRIKGEIRTGSKGVLSEFMEGIAFLRQSREIIHVILLISVFSLIGLPYISLLPVFAAEVFQRGAKGLGFLMSASGIGALSAALYIAAKGDIQNKTRFMSFASLCFSIALFVFSLLKIFSLSLVTIMFGGWGMVSYLAAANSYIQVAVPDELRGRVMSVYSFVFLGTVPIGNAIMGVVADSVGTTHAVTGAGILCIIASGIFAKRYLRSAPST